MQIPWQTLHNMEYLKQNKYMYVGLKNRSANTFGAKSKITLVRVFIKYLITLGYLLRTKRLRAYSL